MPSQRTDVESHCLHPSVLDSMTQVLAPFILDTGKAFILRSIETVDLQDVALPETLWSHATLTASDETTCVGNVRVFDESGKPYVDLSGVAFSVLDRAEAAGARAASNLVIASNFTAEPLEDSLTFWSDHFGVPIHIEFAPYNQTFQQLLDSGSAFRRNSNGANVVLLALEEWAVEDRIPPLALDKERADQCFGQRPRYVLPNGLEIVHLNQYETDAVYKEIFEDHCYLKHGIRLQDGDTVVDIGANIGLFSLFVMSRSANAKVFAFEPAPVVYELLKANCSAYGSNVRAWNLGVADKPGAATFTFYEQSSVFSSLHADEADDRDAVRAVVRNTLSGATSIERESLDRYVHELTADRLRRSTHECQLTSVSEIIRENQIDRIDLLKIDAEKSELDILRGIEAGDWPKICQLVVEVHDRSGQTIKRVQDLLIEKGFHCTAEHAQLLEHSGLVNLYAMRGQASDARSDSGDVDRAAAGPPPAPPRARSLQRHLQEFGAALRSFVQQPAVPLILCLCPRTPAAAADAELNAALDDAEQWLLSEAGTIPNVHAISSTFLLRDYPVSDYYDPHSHQLAHIPYTSACFAAIGTALVRSIFNLKAHPFKVIVLDCDNTLWRGVCGEDGPRGIEVTPPHRTLQEFMIGQMKAGMLLCLCSKNNEQDVRDVFDQRTDMLLQREHLVSQRINWHSKSDNIKSLAAELNLGLDSFIFIDDNPVDCADVKINCPEVLTLQLPRDTASFASFLNHIWAFDRTGSTEEDHNRTQMYQESARRQQFSDRALSLKDFVTGLQLRVDVSDATDDQLGRVSQLTFRTNQFNFTTIRRSEHEIRGFVKRPHATCLVVRVADRFGDYGLVGVVMYVTEADRYSVDTFLLSCRVLGRGVEHAVLSQLGQRAVREGKRFVDLAYRPTEKNVPAMEFITSIGGRYRDEAGPCWSFPAEHLARVTYNPDEKTPIGCEVPVVADPAKHTPRPVFGLGILERSDRLQQIGENLSDIDRLSKAMEEHRARKRSVHATPADRPTSSLEATLTSIWMKVLGRPHIGMNDNFFDVGGTSLRAVQVLAMIRRELNQTLSIVTLFECPTVSLLAAKLRATSGEPQRGTATAAAVLRGRQRRNKAVSRRVS